MLKEFANDLQIIIDLYKDMPPKKTYRKAKIRKEVNEDV